MAISLSGETRLFPVVGDPIAQVKSPALLSALMAERARDAIVPPVHVTPADLEPVIGAFGKLRNLDGVLVTVPHKIAAFSLCSRVTDRARFAGSVNVMRKTAEGWLGDNTDGQGFVNGIELAGQPVTGKKVLLVGCGGAGSAIALEFMVRGAAQLALHDIDHVRRDRVIDALSRRFPGKVAAGSAHPRGFDIIANATPMGMQPDDPLPVDTAGLSADQFVACVITKPENSPLIEAARQRGCRTMNGLGMFAAQADILADFLLFSDKTARED